LPSRAPATAKQQAVLRKHILVADPSLASQDALLEQVATVMKDTWSWDELRKFYLRKTEMRENVEATLELIRDDMDEDEEDAGELPAAPAAAGAGPADDLATESAEEGEVLEIESAASKPAPLASEQVAAGQEVAPTGALPSVASAPAALKPPPAASTSAQPSPDVFGSTSAAKKKPTKHLSSEQAVQLAREKALATGKVWIEPAKKKAMTALRTETEAQLERGEFHTFEAEDQVGRRLCAFPSSDVNKDSDQTTLRLGRAQVCLDPRRPDAQQKGALRTHGRRHLVRDPTPGTQCVLSEMRGAGSGDDG
jgi:hypothetical protein